MAFPTVVHLKNSENIDDTKAEELLGQFMKSSDVPQAVANPLNRVLRDLRGLPPQPKEQEQEEAVVN